MDVGFIGTGLMGLPMAQRLIKAGFTVAAYNRTTAKLEPLRTAGATIAPTPDAVIQHSRCIVLMLTNAAAIRETVLSDASKQVLAGKTVIQMSTIAPAESREICAEVIAAGGDYLEAPVLGSIPEAEAGKLIVMVGGTAEQLEHWTSVLKCFGPEPNWIGPVGTAAAIKLALNQLIGSLTTAFAASLGFVLQQGVPVESFMEILRGSALYAPTFDKKLQRMLDRNYANPNFPTKHLHKDMDLFIQAAGASSVDTRSVEAIRSILAKTVEMGLADADYSALFSAVLPSDN
jgi:3-hydroxyisobutyrate dehydrogenase